MANQFFYDGQIRRFLTQFIRAVSGFQVEFKKGDGNRTLQQVPVIYGDGTRQVAQIISNNSGSTTPTVPCMSVYIHDLRYDRERVQDPTFIGKLIVRERQYDPETGSYTTLQADALTVERPMPVPYKLFLKLDIWTSNTEQKLMLVEQISSLFNPALEIQSTDNYIDWTSLSSIFLSDTSYTSKSIPIGTENPLDVTTLSFELPIWISPPAKIKKMGVIQKIITNIYNSDGQLSQDIFDSSKLLSKQNVTPLNYGIIVLGNQVTLVSYSEHVTETLESDSQNGIPLNWRDLINLYGTLSNGISEIRLELESGNEVIGTIAMHPTDETILLFSPLQDTKPTNTLQPFNAIIDPTKSRPGLDLPIASKGTRYLCIAGYTSPSELPEANWNGAEGRPVVIKENTIIEYDGIKWYTSFAASSSKFEYATNLKTGSQYMWNGSDWVKSYEGFYRGGAWSLVL